MVEEAAMKKMIAIVVFYSCTASSVGGKKKFSAWKIKQRRDST